MELAFVRAIHLRPFLPFPFAFLLRASGYFTTLAGEIIVRHERYFLTISQQKPRKRNFGARKILNNQGIKAQRQTKDR
jgi:hypothetical protein